MFWLPQGPFLVTKAVSKLMIEKKVGNSSIVNISSIVGKVTATTCFLVKKTRGLFIDIFKWLALSSLCSIKFSAVSVCYYR